MFIHQLHMGLQQPMPAFKCNPQDSSSPCSTTATTVAPGPALPLPQQPLPRRTRHTTGVAPECGVADRSQLLHLEVQLFQKRQHVQALEEQQRALRAREAALTLAASGAEQHLQLLHAQLKARGMLAAGPPAAAAARVWCGSAEGTNIADSSGVTRGVTNGPAESTSSNCFGGDDTDTIADADTGRPSAGRHSPACRRAPAECRRRQKQCKPRSGGPGAATARHGPSAAPPGMLLAQQPIVDAAVDLYLDLIHDAREESLLRLSHWPPSPELPARAASLLASLQPHQAMHPLLRHQLLSLNLETRRQEQSPRGHWALAVLSTGYGSNLGPAARARARHWLRLVDQQMWRLRATTTELQERLRRLLSAGGAAALLDAGGLAAAAAIELIEVVDDLSAALRHEAVRHNALMSAALALLPEEGLPQLLLAGMPYWPDLEEIIRATCEQ